MSVACGANSTFLLTQDGTVWAFGNNQMGQLGISKSNSSSIFYKPNKVTLGLPVVQVAAGENHTLFLTMGGQVYAVGDNSHCQLAKGKD